jgi:hypothetical protein
MRRLDSASGDDVRRRCSGVRGDGEQDVFYYGPGKDYAFIGLTDIVAPDCEIVEEQTTDG